MICSGKYVGSPRPVSTTVSVSPLCASWIAFLRFRVLIFGAWRLSSWAYCPETQNWHPWGMCFVFSVGLNGTVHLLVPVTTLRMEYFMFSPSSSKGCFDFM